MTDTSREEIERLLTDLDSYGHPWQSRVIRAILDERAALKEETVYLRKQWENAEAAIAECKGQNEWLDRQLTLALTPRET